MAKAKTRRRPAARKNPPARKRRAAPAPVARRKTTRARRNPDFAKMLKRGAMDVAGVVGGEVAANLIAAQIPVFMSDSVTKVETVTGKAVRQLLGAGAVAWAASQFLGVETARVVAAGALAAPVRSFVRSMLPTTGAFSKALAAYPQPRALVSGIGGGRLAAYPEYGARRRRAITAGPSLGAAASTVTPFAYAMAGS